MSRTRVCVYYNVFCPCPENVDGGDRDFIENSDRVSCKHAPGPAKNKLRSCLDKEDAKRMAPSDLLTVLFLLKCRH